jgi:hypothetical protein
MGDDPFVNQKNADVPASIAFALQLEGQITPTLFEDKNDILSNVALQQETGFGRLPSGDYLVSMICPMPGITAEMVDWWFWWHPQNKLRYQLWYPGEHYTNGYARKDHAYFNAPQLPAFQPNTQYPVERIGDIKMPLVIDFVSPEAFGFDRSVMKQNQVATIVCGHVGAYRGLIQHTEMAHIFFQKENGLFHVSRFWLGKRLKNPLIRNFMLTDETARGMATHCCIEYRNLASKLPLLYQAYYK